MNHFVSRSAEGQRRGKMSITIRLACLEDIPILTTLIPESVRVLQVGYYTPQQIEGALGTIFGVDSQLIDDGTYFVAECVGKIVGCGGWSQRKTLYGGDSGKDTKENVLLNPNIEPAKIRAFFVHPTWVRRGIGSLIMEKCQDAAVNAGFKTIEIVATLAGEPFYEAFGYKVTEKFDIPLQNSEVLPVVRMFRAFTDVENADFKQSIIS
jgi:GNAT superfamily N-acetyltransferase